MPRVVKHPDIRRNEMLDRALALFLRHGYDNVSLNHVIAESRSSKGAFYHWFPSKDALIVALAERSAQQGLDAVEDALTQCDGDALERLNTLLRVAFDVKMTMGIPEQLAAAVSLLRPDNAHLYARIVAAGEQRFQPVFTRVISDGVAEGRFDTFDPDGVADMILGLAARVNTKILDVLRATEKSTRDRAVDALTTRFRLHGLVVDRILGLPDGSITVLTRTQVETMLAALPRDFASTMA